MGLFKVLLVNLFRIVLLVSTYELLNPELHSAKFYYIEFLYPYTEVLLHLLLKLIISISNNSPNPIQACLIWALVSMGDLKVAGLVVSNHFE